MSTSSYPSRFVVVVLDNTYIISICPTSTPYRRCSGPITSNVLPTGITSIVLPGLQYCKCKKLWIQMTYHDKTLSQYLSSLTFFFPRSTSFCTFSISSRSLLSCQALSTDTSAADYSASYQHLPWMAPLTKPYLSSTDYQKLPRSLLLHPLKSFTIFIQNSVCSRSRNLCKRKRLLGTYIEHWKRNHHYVQFCPATVIFKS